MNARNEQSAYDRDFATPVRDPAIWEEASLRYDRCHPGDSFADLAHRSSFSKEDRRLLEDWLAATARLIRQPFGADANAGGPTPEERGLAKVARAWREAIGIAVRSR